MEDDTADADGDAATDKFVQVAWADVDAAWPGGGCTTTNLFTANFSVLAGWSGVTPIRFSTSSAATGYEFGSVPAVVTLAIYAITASASPAVGGTVNCTPSSVDYDGTSNCTATANPGYTFAEWSGNCTGTGTSCTLTNVTTAKTVTATFTLNQYTLTVNIAGTGTGTVGGGGTYDYNTLITPTASAAAGSTLTGWEPSTCGSAFALTADTTCTAIFTLSPTNGVWATIAPMLTARANPGIAAIDTHRTLVCGGGQSASDRTCEIFDVLTGQWSSAASANAVSWSVRMVPLDNGRILAVGGNLGTQDNIYTEIYDPVTNAWQYTGNLQNNGGSPYKYGGVSVVKLADGRVLLSGSRMYPWCTSSSAAQLYDPATGQWTVTGNMNIARQQHSLILLNTGKVLVVGGFLENGCNGANLLSQTELFDPVTGVWTLTGNMSVARLAAAVAKLQDGRVLVCGGRSVWDGAYLNTCELYDPNNGLWSNTGSMKTSGAGWRSATVLSDGRVLMAGGYGNNNLPIEEAEIYDPATGQWTNIAAMNIARQDHGAVWLSDSRVMVIGGYDPSISAPLNSVETYSFAGSQTYTLTVTRSGTGVGTVTADAGTILWNGNVGTATYNNGATVMLSVSPATGSAFTGWSGGGCTGTAPCQVTMDAVKDVTATFILNDYTLTVIKAGTGAGTVTGGGTYAYNTTVTPGATPATGSTFTVWTPASCASAFALTADTTCTANFTLNTYAIAASASPAVGGTVNCASNPVDYDGSSTCTAAANPGYTFAQWSGDCTGTGTSCTLTNVTVAKSVTANFGFNIVTSVSPTGAGTVSCMPNPVAPVGTSTCTAWPSPGHVFAGWRGDCAGRVGTICTLSNINSAKAVVATYVEMALVLPSRGGWRAVLGR
ncbi:kelch repeat-containing protein [uncultured Thiodictyon sp.]|uniref:InlB B-repeat-containing protein n=1 Tax=uncultured Thiodictyon sp. TaxID=1846217 RepID=UPI0025F9841C|nr:kelch repeat-containing protein [uncultured Thiodictyon sp.]